MKIKFQADSDLNQRIIEAVCRRNPAIDFQTADEAGIRGFPDPRVLAYAASEERVLVSHDRKTMPTYFANFVATQHSSGLVLLAQKLPISIAIEELLLIWEASEAEEWIDTFKWIPL
ncbi:MAG: DUF5615 family PIN-like protein [Acidobacteriota bacterium]